MRKVKVLLALFVLLGSVFGGAKASALDSSLVSSNYEYVITEYNVDMVVNENNTYDITERITADFNVPKHGIFRKIPLYNKITRQDGTKTNNRAKISNVKVSAPFSTEHEDGYLKLKIGDADKTLTGEQSYTISYNYNIGKDRAEGKDELYFDLIGSEWDTTISGVSYTITMPKEFDKDKLGFSTGTTGSMGSDMLSYYVSGNKITGKMYGTLKSGEGLNVRLELPEGYFVGAGIEINPVYYAFYVVPVIGLIVAIYFWAKYGKDRKVFVKPEYFPPKGFNSLEVGFLYKGGADSKDVISLLIYLANKGYLKIEEYEEKGVFSKKKSFKLTKVKEYDGENDNEKLFLKGLFKSGDTVTASDLYDEFYKTTTKIISNTNSRENKEKIFEKNGKFSAIVGALTVVSFILITLPPFMLYGDYEEMMFAILFPAVGLTVLVAGFSAKGNPLFVQGFLILWGLLFGGIPMLFMVVPELMLDSFFMVVYPIGFVAVVGMIVFLALLPKRTEYGAEKLAEVKGLKDFLESVEKDRIEKMVEEYPTYFYDILPFAYVLGVSEKWIAKFESMNLKAPDWYSGSEAFSMGYFSGFMSSTMAAASSNMSSTSSHSSGSGGGGGGSVGGGSGGGGGGSW